MGMHIEAPRIAADEVFNLIKERKEKIKIAKELGYPEHVIQALKEANTPGKLENIMHDARKEWDVAPGRYTATPVETIRSDVEDEREMA